MALTSTTVPPPQATCLRVRVYFTSLSPGPRLPGGRHLACGWFPRQRTIGKLTLVFKAVSSRDTGHSRSRFGACPWPHLPHRGWTQSSPCGPEAFSGDCPPRRKQARESLRTWTWLLLRGDRGPCPGISFPRKAGASGLGLSGLGLRGSRGQRESERPGPWAARASGPLCGDGRSPVAGPVVLAHSPALSPPPPCGESCGWAAAASSGEASG